MNRSKRDKCNSKYKGVSWYEKRKRWRSYIRVNGKRKSLGYYKIEEEAAKAYNKAAIKHFKEYALLNDIRLNDVDNTDIFADFWL